MARAVHRMLSAASGSFFTAELFGQGGVRRDENRAVAVIDDHAGLGTVRLFQKANRCASIAASVIVASGTCAPAHSMTVCAP